MIWYYDRVLQAIILKPVNPPAVVSNTFSYHTGKFYVPDDSLEAYKTAENWSGVASLIYGYSQLAIDYPEYYEKYITQG